MKKFKEHIENYLEYCHIGKNLNSKTIRAYRTDLKQFFIYSEADDADCDKTTVEGYIASLRGNGCKTSTVKRKIASIRAYYRYLEYENVITLNPLRLIRTDFRKERPLPKVLSFRTVQAILCVVYEKYKITSRAALLRDIVVIETLFATGVRVAELSFLRAENIDIATGKVNIWGKGSRERIVQICNPDVLSKLKEYEDVFQDEINTSGYFFVNRSGRRLSEQSVRNIIRNHTNAAGIDQHVTPHMFRHTFATLLLEEDVDIRYIQRMLGHSSIKTTEIYTHVALQKQKEILTLKHPRNKMGID
jgi:integrase/recombinase XerD